jgi:tetratricopeptide (TPR) repeat protein
MASTEQIAKEYYDKGISLVRSNNIEMGINNLNMAKSIYEELNDSTHYILSLRWLAIAYGIMGYDSKMLYKCLNAFNYIDKNGIRGAKHYFYTTICNRYLLLGDYDSAVNYGKMALQDLEDHGTEFENGPQAYLVACLNLAYAYLHINRCNEAETYLKRAAGISSKNDLKNHELSITVMNASLHHKMGDDQYVYDHIEELVSSIKGATITINDYLEDIKLIIETFCSMKEFERAEAVAQSLNSFGTLSGDVNLKLEATKFYMMIYKESGEKEKYHQACVDFAENSITLSNKQATQHLQEMDTAIALSIADTPLELL